MTQGGAPPPPEPLLLSIPPPPRCVRRIKAAPVELGVLAAASRRPGPPAPCSSLPPAPRPGGQPRAGDSCGGRAGELDSVGHCTAPNGEKSTFLILGREGCFLPHKGEVRVGGGGGRWRASLWFSPGRGLLSPLIRHPRLWGRGPGASPGEAGCPRASGTERGTPCPPLQPQCQAPEVRLPVLGRTSAVPVQAVPSAEQAQV